MLPAIRHFGLAACSLVLLPASLCGQSPSPNPVAAADRSQVALVDIVKVFENHHRFKQQMESIKNEITSFERELNQQRDAIAQQSQRLTSSTSDVERRRIETEVARQMADLQVKAQLKRNELLEREAALYFETYQDVQQRVARVAQIYNIKLVLRYDSSAMNPNERGTVLKGINHPIVYQRNLDLTQQLINGGGHSDTSQNAPPRDPPRISDRSVGQRLPFSMNLSR